MTTRFADSRASLFPATLLACMSTALGGVMVLTPSVFVSEPPHGVREISSPTMAFLVGLLILTVTAFLYRAKYREAIACHPAVTLRPDGMHLEAAGATKCFPWSSVMDVDLRWEGGAETLVVRTDSGTFKIPHTRVSGELKRVAEAITIYREAHAPEASSAA